MKPSPKKREQSGETPVIFWQSDPVGPDETVLLSGHFPGQECVVEISPLDSGDPGDPPQTTVPDHLGEGVVNVKPVSQTPHSLAFIIPSAWQPGVYSYRVRNESGVSSARFLNNPDAWWLQGDAGLAAATPGGWLRALGKSLAGGAISRVALRGKDNGTVFLDAINPSAYSLEFHLPVGISQGEYEVWLHNGKGGNAAWSSAGGLAVQGNTGRPGPTVNILDFDADPEGRRDCTVCIVGATERLTALGGGTVLFPRGRYRIDSILRSGTWISSPIMVPRGVSFRGEGHERTSLWWPDREQPLISLLDCAGHNRIEDIAIYTQGRHRHIIQSEGDDVTVRNVFIRANCHYMTNVWGGSHHRRGVPEKQTNEGALLAFNGGRNIKVENCDLYGSNYVFSLMHLRGARISGCRARGHNFAGISGGEGLIFEHNEYEGNSLTSSGSNISLYMGATRAEHIYFAHNKTARIFGGDHEGLTFDGHGTAYLGRASSLGADVVLAADPQFGMDGVRDNMPSPIGLTLYVLLGRGHGQWRHVKSLDGRAVVLESPLDVTLDDTSVVTLGAFNGRHLIVGNVFEETGPSVQLYPPNCECLVAENRSRRCAGLNGYGRLGLNKNSRFKRVEPSWRHLYLDNVVEIGNGWGGGESETDRWLGGEASLNIWDWQVAFWLDHENCGQDAQLTEPDLEKLFGFPNPVPGQPLSLTSFQVVRRHVIENNASIRVRGSVRDALIEHCDLRDSKYGIRIDNEVIKEHCPDLGQLAFEPPQPEIPAGDPPPFLSPRGIILRKNKFAEVEIPYSGTALRWAKRTED
jgi:hypothetical protein